jgi:hypothetical protein
MTTRTTTAEDRPAQLGIRLPDAPTPFGTYVLTVHRGSLLFLSGMLATSGHAATAVGIVGKDLIALPIRYLGGCASASRVDVGMADVLAAGAFGLGLPQ